MSKVTQIQREMVVQVSWAFSRDETAFSYTVEQWVINDARVIGRRNNLEKFLQEHKEK